MMELVMIVLLAIQLQLIIELIILQFINAYVRMDFLKIKLLFALLVIILGN